MNTQNIFNYYGTKFDVKLDSSEYYDYQLSKIRDDYNSDVLDLGHLIVYSALTINPDCFSGSTENFIPMEIEIDKDVTIMGCDLNIRKRTEKGWTLDFIFNRNSNPWISGSTFYYWGVKDETNPDFYLDNNLSFSFTENGEIMWEAVHYTGYCETISGYTESDYISSGLTPTLCTTGLTDNFNITITFERYKYLEDCEIENDGGWNDLITGKTVTNAWGVVNSSEEPTYEYIEQLTNLWLEERLDRLGTLKIYLNGNPIYKLEDWEEIVPSVRGEIYPVVELYSGTTGNTNNPIVQIWGGGTENSGDVHEGETAFIIRQFKYFEEPLDYVHVKHHYLTENSVDFNIVECGDDCDDNLTSL